MAHRSESHQGATAATRRPRNRHAASFGHEDEGQGGGIAFPQPAESTSPVDPNAKSLIPLKPLGFTSQTSWAESDVERVFNEGEAALDDSDIKGPVPIGAAGEGFVSVLGGEQGKKMKIAAFGDTSFVTNQFLRTLYNDALGQNVVSWLAGAEEQGHGTPRLQKTFECIRLSIELPEVAVLELSPLPRFMIEPLAKRGARRDILHPIIQQGLLLGDATRPDPVHQDTMAIGLDRRLVRAFQLHGWFRQHVCSSDGDCRSLRVRRSRFWRN